MSKRSTATIGWSPGRPFDPEQCEQTMTMTKTALRGLTVPVQQLPHADGLALPTYQTAGSAGMDLTAAVPANKPVRLVAGARALIPTGLVMALPAGAEAQVRPRSGLALKQGLTVLNSPGTIDSDYRGEVQVILVNLSRETAVVRRGDRIAQMVIAPVTQAKLTLAVTLGGTVRGAGGFGSTGTVAAARAPARKPAKPAPGGARTTSKAKPKSVVKAAAKAAAGSTPVRVVKKSNKVAKQAVRGKAVAAGAAKRGHRSR